jgi:hypothetical protein
MPKAGEGFSFFGFGSTICRPDGAGDERRAKIILRWTFGGSAGVAPAGLGVAPEPSLDKLVCLTGFRRDAENGDRDGRAPHSRIVAADVNRLIILRAVFLDGADSRPLLRS